MHIKSFVLASFAVSIVTAVPVPQFCPFTWKRSAQEGPQTEQLPSLLPYLSDPSSVPNYSPRPYPCPALIQSTPGLERPIEGETEQKVEAPAKAITETRPPPQPVNEFAPWLIPAGAAAGWGINNLLRIKGNPTQE